MLIPIHAIQKLFSVAEVHASFFLLDNPFIIKPEITFIENYLFSSYLFIKCKQLTYRVEVLEFAALLPGQTGIQKHKSRQGLGIPALVNFSHLVQSFMHCLQCLNWKRGFLKSTLRVKGCRTWGGGYLNMIMQFIPCCINASIDQCTFNQFGMAKANILAYLRNMLHQTNILCNIFKPPHFLEGAI